MPIQTPTNRVPNIIALNVIVREKYPSIGTKPVQPFHKLAVIVKNNRYTLASGVTAAETVA